MTHYDMRPPEYDDEPIPPEPEETMSELERKALAVVPLSREEVAFNYERMKRTFEGGTIRFIFRRLCESHERLRMELEGVIKLYTGEPNGEGEEAHPARGSAEPPANRREEQPRA